MIWYVVALVYHLSGDVIIKVLREPNFDSFESCSAYVESSKDLGIELLVGDATRLKMRCLDESVLGISSI